METRQRVEATEVLELFRKVLNAEVQITQITPSYPITGSDGLFTLEADKYLVTIFIDAGELDYVDSVIAPDGRDGDYDYWTLHSEAQKDPIDLLSDVEHKRLELHVINGKQ